MPWSTSQRRAQLPKTAQWDRIRSRVKARADGRCQATVHAPSCNGTGTDCDHIADPHDHTLPNLQWLSHPCHQAKTQAEAVAAKPSRRRTNEPNPGMR